MALAVSIIFIWTICEIIGWITEQKSITYEIIISNRERPHIENPTIEEEFPEYFMDLK